jgi:hypothetical protein
MAWYPGWAGAETWTKHQIYKKTRLCNGLDPADFNRDGLTDYVTNFEDTGAIVVVLHPGPERTRQPWPAVTVGQFDRAESSCAGDLDGDGWPDVAVAHGHEAEDETAGVTVVWNPGQRGADPSGATWVNSDFIPGSIELGNYLFIRAADINGDGAMDLVAGGRQALHATPAYDNPDPNVPSVGVIWLEAPAGGESRRDMTKWRVHDIDSDIVSGHGFDLGDLDGDGDLDVALANADWGTPKGQERVLWYENPGCTSSALRSDWPRHVLYTSADFYTKPGVCIGDVDGDGHADILSQVNDRILFFRNGGSRPARFQRIEIRKPPHARWRSRPIAIADLNGDGRREIISGLIHHDGLFPRDKAAIVVIDCVGDPLNARHWRFKTIKWSDGFRGRGRFDGEKWDNFFFDDVDRDGDLDIVANCEEYKNLGVEWFENPGGLKVTALGKIYTPAPGRVPISQSRADMGGNTSVRNNDADHLIWKEAGYYQRNRDLGQVFTAEKAFFLDAIVLRTGPAASAVKAGTPGAKVFVQFFEVVGTPRINDNGTPLGDKARHGFSTNHRCDDYLEGIRYEPIRLIKGGVFPDIPPTRDWEGNVVDGDAGKLVYMRWDLLGADEIVCQAGQRYAFMIGFEEPGVERAFTLANRNAASAGAVGSLTDASDAYHGGWGLRREGDGSLPPTMIGGDLPPARARLREKVLAESLYADGAKRYALAPTTDGYPDVDTYRDQEFYLEVRWPGPGLD